MNLRTSIKAEARRRSYLAACGTIVPFWFVDVALPGSAGWAAGAVRAGWAGLFLVAALLVRRASDRTLDRLALVAAAVSAAAMTALATLTGGAASPYLYAFPLLPLLNAMLEPWDEWPAWISGLSAAVGAGSIVVGDGTSLAVAGAWTGGVAASTVWATFGLRELRRSRQAATDASRLAAIGRLASGVAHEINNPLAFARANLQFLRESLPSTSDGDELRAAADEALIGLDRIRGIVQDLRGFTRADGDERAPLPPPLLIDEALRISAVQLRSRVRLVRVVDDALPWVHVNRGRLVQVLVNLLANAADALEGRPDGEVRIGAEVVDDRLRLFVEDNGPGVPARQRKRLFEPFATTKEAGRGLGLGLALSREYAERLGGTLRYEDRCGGGARFVLEVPAGSPPTEGPRARDLAA